MRSSQLLIATEKQNPANADVISHTLMIRAGLIRQVASGVYSYLPTGLKVLQKVSKIVREELDKINANEVLLPNIIPADLWQESNRWDQYGHLLLKIKDRHDRDFCFGPTHEEVITDLARKEIKSHRQLPITLYQIQTKFRDELRPRFGTLRAREFIMKDAYSFHLSDACLSQTYETMRQAYCTILDRLGLKYRMVLADSGDIGGDLSHEFHVLAESGEDDLYYSSDSHYAANVERAETIIPPKSKDPQVAMQLIETPDIRTIVQLKGFLQCQPEILVKTLIAKNNQGEFFAIILRADHTLNEIKVTHLPQFQGHFAIATPDEIDQVFDQTQITGFIGPANCPIPVIVDHHAAALANFTCGANRLHHHYQNANWDRDITDYSVADLRNVESGDPSPDGQGTLQHTKGIEVGHIFQLGTKYSDRMNYQIQNEHKQNQAVTMGCYGLGISRIVAAAIEQNHDDKGIIWPMAMAPYQVGLLGIQYHKNEAIKQLTDQIYQTLRQAGIEVLLEDRNERPGRLFADLDLIGIPHRVVVNPDSLTTDFIEYKSRISEQSQLISVNQLIDTIMHAEKPASTQKQGVSSNA